MFWDFWDFCNFSHEMEVEYSTEPLRFHEFLCVLDFWHFFREFKKLKSINY